MTDSSLADRFFGFESTAAIKQPCRAASTANVAFVGSAPFGFQTIDGVAVTDNSSLPGQAQPDRVLLKNQADQTQNGIWIVQSTAWLRAPDFDGARDLVTGTVVFIVGGTANANTFYQLTCSDNPITVGTSSLTFAQLGVPFIGSTALTYLSNFASLAAADAAAVAIGGTLVIDKNYTVGGNTTVAAAEVLFLGGILTRGSHTLTFQGFVNAGEETQCFDLAGTGLVTFQKNTEFSVALFGALQFGIVDVTNALQQAINCVQASATFANTTSGITPIQGSTVGGRLRWPCGWYLTTAAITYSQNYISNKGGGGQTTKILFRPTANASAVVASNGANELIDFGWDGIGGWSDDTTYVKVFLDLFDLSVPTIRDVQVSGIFNNGIDNLWHDSTNASIGICTHGREQYGVFDYELQCDNPIVISANPNTAASAGEDMDHGNWVGGYLLPHTSKACIHVDDGLGVQETEFKDHSFVGGTKAFEMNDTRVNPPVPSRNIIIDLFRSEQQTDITKYAFDFKFATQVQSLTLSRGTVSSTSLGLSVDKFERIKVDTVAFATQSGKTAINLTAAASYSVFEHSALNVDLGVLLNIPGMILRNGAGFNSANYAAPSHGTWVAVATAHQFDFRYSASIVGSFGTPRYLIEDSFSLAPGASQNIAANINGQGVTALDGTICGTGGGVLEGGTIIGNGTTLAIAGTATSNFAITNTASKLCWYLDGSNNWIVLNNTAQTLHITYRAGASLT